MTPISKQTAMDIALAYREVEAGEELLTIVREAIGKHARDPVDIRDAFGRIVNGLQLGIPSGASSQRILNVSYDLAIPIIETHIAQKRTRIALLTQQAAAEMAAPEAAHVQG